jgi:hypothetical protein
MTLVIVMSLIPHSDLQTLIMRITFKTIGSNSNFKPAVYVKQWITSTPTPALTQLAHLAHLAHSPVSPRSQPNLIARSHRFTGTTIFHPTPERSK